MYNELAHNYDRLRPPENIVYKSLLYEIKKIPKVKVILDIGCGTGRYSIELSKELGLYLIGIDISKNMLKEAKKKFPEGKWIEGDIEKVIEKIDLRKINVILMAYSIHLINWKETLNYLCQFLSSGSLILIVTYSPEIFSKALYHQFIPELIKIEQGRYPPCENVIEYLQNLNSRVLKRVIKTTQWIENVNDIKNVIKKGKAKYCSTLRMVDDEILKKGLQNMEKELLSRISKGPYRVVHEHTIIIAVTENNKWHMSTTGNKLQR